MSIAVVGITGKTKAVVAITGKTTNGLSLPMM